MARTYEVIGWTNTFSRDYAEAVANGIVDDDLHRMARAIQARMGEDAMSTFYAVVVPDEDGHCFKHVRDIDALLTDPAAEVGITRWENAAYLGANPDPSYWPEGTGVLLKCEAIVPTPAGAYVLP